MKTAQSGKWEVKKLGYGYQGKWLNSDKELESEQKLEAGSVWQTDISKYNRKWKHRNPNTWYETNTEAQKLSAVELYMF